MGLPARFSSPVWSRSMPTLIGPVVCSLLPEVLLKAPPWQALRAEPTTSANAATPSGAGRRRDVVWGMRGLSQGDAHGELPRRADAVAADLRYFGCVVIILVKNHTAVNTLVALRSLG